MPRRRTAPHGDAEVGVAILDALPIGLYVVDRDLRVVAWNRQREKGPLGQPRASVLGRPLNEVLPARGFQATRPVLERVFQTGRPHEETVEGEGARLHHVLRLPIRRGRRITHVLSCFDDITEQKALEMRVIATDRLAFLGQLVAGVAHEVSNPLAGIAGCAEALASLALKPQTKAQRREVKEFHELIRGEVARCERIIRSLLESARPQPGKSAQIAPVVAVALRVLERHPAFARTRVASRIPASLPPARIDPDSLKQVVMALAVNAAKAMPGGGTLTLRGGRAGESLFLDVLDTGPGVPRALRRQIFKPYFTTDASQGTGLGLAIARSLVRARGGDLTYLPRRRGAAFRVLLQPEKGRP